MKSDVLLKHKRSVHPSQPVWWERTPFDGWDGHDLVREWVALPHYGIKTVEMSAPVSKRRYKRPAWVLK